MPRKKPKVRAPYKMVSPPTWELARAAYLGGMTAEAVAEKYDIGLHNLRQTIARKGWSKRALADARALAGPGGPPVPAPVAATPPSPEPASPPAPPITVDMILRSILDVAMVRAGKAIIAGTGAEASALIKATREWVTLNAEVVTARAEVPETGAPLEGFSPGDQATVREQVALLLMQESWAKKT
ncbi:hypothetical protein [Brevundimonas lenta]|uniref:Uncharacterized protein n=1 Tax=Brevundimonas lenta TaxID=424796 RepID=A0A7W6JEI9_9CAUL|nr:hypothetical protein [Brevundimonas lenta]MBB4082711.1 hypothetical protein [Brevundimonas lenta]